MADKAARIANFVAEFATVLQQIEEHKESLALLNRDVAKIERELRMLKSTRNRLCKRFAEMYSEFKED